MDGMNDDQLDQWLDRAAKEYHEPPGPAPRDAMWQRIEARRREASVPGRRVLRLRYLVPLGLAATLAIGIGLGRLSTRAGRGTAPASIAPAAPAGASVALTTATLDHLAHAEVFLTGFRSARAAGQPDLMATQARELLATTRLLIDAPDLTDPRIRSLLEELELVLVQITQLTAAGADRDLDLITNGLEQRGTLPRLRTLVPSGNVPTHGAS
jgi:hypothetical protein